MLKLNCDYDFTSFTLIIPSVAVGNVGQLAADLLISTFSMEKVGTIWSSAIIPVIGGNPYDLASDDMMVSCELYANSAKNIAVLQLRSPLVKKLTPNFLNEVTEIVKTHNLSKIIILTSSFASERHDISSVPFRYLSNIYVDDSEVFPSLKWISYGTGEENDAVIHGGGFAKKFFDILTSNNTPCIVLFKYCSEGDNIPDAHEMLHYLNKYVKFSENLEPIPPPSWTLLFGNPPPQDIY